MPNKNNPIERDPSSGRPLMKDVVSRASKLSPARITVKKQSKASETLAQKNETEKKVIGNKFLEIKKEEKKSKLPKTKISLILCGTAVLLVVIFIFIKSISEVTVSVVPRQTLADIDSNFDASANSSAPISLEIVSAQDTIELEGAIDKTSSGNEKAKGKIVIYNAYSTQVQALVASTRFEAPGGKIYRIQTGVVIPGGKMEAGKLVPGQLEVSVYADQSGAEYNIGLSDFTIPGFKGTPKFEKIYARSKTEISGGFSGGVKIVTKSVINSLLLKAGENFKTSIKDKIQKDLPEGAYIPESAVDVKITLLSADPEVNSTADKVRIKAKAAAQVAVLKEGDLIKALALKYLELKSGESVQISNLGDLNFQVLNKNFNEKNMTFRITGRAHFVWLFDEASLKKDLSGASRDARQNVFKNYTGIDRAEIIFKPSWFRVFPSNLDKIRVVLRMTPNS